MIFNRELKFLILLLLIFSSFISGKDKERNRTTYIATVELLSKYDNNILRYSDYYIEKFLSGNNDGRFHISTYDDFIISPKLQLTIKKKLFFNSKAEISFAGRFNKFVVNPIKNWGMLNLSVKQNFPTATTFLFFYTYTPHYYIRHYRNRQWTEMFGDSEMSFKEYSFAKDNFEIYVTQHISKLFSFKLYYGKAKYYYSKYFTEHDSKRDAFGIRTYLNFGFLSTGNFGVKYIKSSAHGNKYINPSFYELKYFAGFTYRFRKFFGIKNSCYLYAMLSKRFYTSSFSTQIDPIHAGRFDNYYGITYNHKFYLIPNGTILFFASWKIRNSASRFSATSGFISREKNFTQFFLGVKYRYSIKF